jgi:Short C-terminal domain
MPGLLRGMARTAVVAGTATAVSNRVSRRQAQKWGYMDEQQPSGGGGYYEQAPPPPPPAAAEPPPDPIAQLKQLAALKDQGILTDEEFAAQKAKILGP